MFQQSLPSMGKVQVSQEFNSVVTVLVIIKDNFTQRKLFHRIANHGGAPI